MIIGGIVMAAAGFVLGTKPSVPGEALDAYNKALTGMMVCGALYIMTFIFALIAAIFCFKRTKWMMSFIMSLMAFLFR